MLEDIQEKLITAPNQRDDGIDRSLASAWLRL